MPAFSQAFHMENVMLDRTPSRELQEHLWVFPMDYPIKLIGNARDICRAPAGALQISLAYCAIAF